MPKKSSPNVMLAVDVLRGKEIPPRDMLALAKRLKQENAFGLARKLLARACKTPVEDRVLQLELAQQHALCTYKDPDLPLDDRLTRALGILAAADDLRVTKNQETLGLAGAVYKRRWQVDAQKQNLERSLAYYLRGYREGAASDFGYTGINAAFVLDLLADQESTEAEEAGTRSQNAAERLETARKIREDLTTVLPALREQPGNEWLAQTWWFLVTVAEAYFGLQRYDEARDWLVQARALPEVPDWEFASTARQLAALTRLHGDSATGYEGTPAWNVLKAFLGEDADAVQTVFAGKVGLALSGGGFRASLFHIGVLARLAERDMLRHVEVLSCVSGGSIIGAHYYLEVRKLLQEKEDGRITRQDYIDLVQRVERDFLAGVQTNIRTRVGAELWTNLKMIFKRDYSRTERVGELYESEIFSRIDDGEGDKPRWLNDLFVQPRGPDGQPRASFNPKYDNWRRRNKVPILILNATTLNTGHNWQFTASWMGESPFSIDAEIDGNYRLRRMYYYEAPQPYRRVRLGHAVGASSCVPGLFEPLVMAGLYERRDEEEGKVRLTVRLVDGGVHDNQGVVGLLEQDCTVLLVSDASGQMGTLDRPGRGPLGVPLRSNSILMARVREAEYHDLEARRRASLLRGLMFVHLKKDLRVDPVDWVDTEDPYDPSDEARAAGSQGPLTSYGIQKTLQRRLANIRTDLDSFNDAEAYALMTSGYLMTSQALDGAVEEFPASEGAQPAWRFLRLKKQMTEKAGSESLAKLLDIAGGRFFKVWKLSASLRAVAILLGLLVVGGFLGVGWIWVSFLMRHFVWPVAAVIGVITGFIALVLLGWLVVRLHLHVFDQWYLRRGAADRIAGP